MAVSTIKTTQMTWGFLNSRLNREPIDAASLNNSYTDLLWELNQTSSTYELGKSNTGGSSNFYVGLITSVPYVNKGHGKNEDGSLKGPWYVTYCGSDSNEGTGKYAFTGHIADPINAANTYYADRIVLKRELDYALDKNTASPLLLGTYYTGVGHWYDSYTKSKEYRDENKELPDGIYFPTTSYAEIFNDYTNNVATGEFSHAEGQSTTASGNFGSHTEGYSTAASGNDSHAEGYETTASGVSSHAEGNYTTASNYASHASGKYNVTMTEGGSKSNTTGTAFVIGNGTDTSALSNAFSVQFDGTVKAQSTITASTTADYAEFFEWLDGNPDNEDRVGYFVALDGDKIKIASNEDDYILGVISGEPFVLGNGDCDTWNEMYLHDEFRRTIYEPAPKVKEVLDEEGHPTGEYEVVEGEYEGTRPVLNPKYDPSKVYISRFERKEWSPVGMLGVLAVRHDGTAKVNGYVTVNKDGIATACDRKSEKSYRVIKSKTDNVVEIIFR